MTFEILGCISHAPVLLVIASCIDSVYTYCAGNRNGPRTWWKQDSPLSWAGGHGRGAPCPQASSRDQGPRMKTQCSTEIKEGGVQWLTLYVPWRQRWPLVILPSHVLREESTVTEGSAGTSSMVPYDTIVPWAHAPVGLPGIPEFTGQMREVRSTGVQGPACRAPWLWQPGAAAPTPAPSSSCSPGRSGFTAPRAGVTPRLRTATPSSAACDAQPCGSGSSWMSFPDATRAFWVRHRAGLLQE